MRTVAIFTTARADFGIFSALLRELQKCEDIAYHLFVGGSHLARELGLTIDEIQKENFEITATFDFLLNRDSSVSLAKSTGVAVYELAHIFDRFQFDFVCILGDRFELLAIVINAILFKKPIIHIHGGERSEGAIDEQIRHMVTKAAHVHFVASREFAWHVRQMGEPEWRIHNTGALGVDNIVHGKKIPKLELFQSLKIDVAKPTVIMTYHPVTLEFSLSSLQQVMNVFSALSNYDFQLVITAPNIEVDSQEIIAYIKHEAMNNPNYHYFESLGTIPYHSLLPHCKFVVGNSSSGILEVPYFKIPTVNIGDRQKGRVRHKSIIDTDYTAESISKGIEKALSESFQKSIQDMEFRFGDGSAAPKMVKFIRNIKIDQRLLRKQLDFPDYKK